MGSSFWEIWPGGILRRDSRQKQLERICEKVERLLGTFGEE